MEIAIKIFKFIGLLAWLAVMVVLFSIFGWGGLVVGLVVTFGGAAIFSGEW
jgi:hypothetical protein